MHDVSAMTNKNQHAILDITCDTQATAEPTTSAQKNECRRDLKALGFNKDHKY